MENTILINDLLNLSDDEMRNTKIKFNQDNGNEDQMEVYIHDPELINNQWLFSRTKQRYFEVNQIAICFLNSVMIHGFSRQLRELQKNLALLRE